MNNTRRSLNRFFSFVVGFFLFILGSAGLALTLFSPIRAGWKQTAPDVLAVITDWFGAALIPTTTVSWWWIALIAALTLVIVMLVVFVLQQGHGRTSRWITETSTGRGKIALEARVAEDLVQETLDSRTDLVSSHVSTYMIRGTPVLKISATARRGVSPKGIVDDVERSIRALERLVGRAVLVSIQVSGGFRSRVAKATKLP